MAFVFECVFVWMDNYVVFKCWNLYQPELTTNSTRLAVWKLTQLKYFFFLNNDTLQIGTHSIINFSSHQVRWFWRNETFNNEPFYILIQNLNIIQFTLNRCQRVLVGTLLVNNPLLEQTTF